MFLLKFFFFFFKGKYWFKLKKSYLSISLIKWNTIIDNLINRLSDRSKIIFNSAFELALKNKTNLKACHLLYIILSNQEKYIFDLLKNLNVNINYLKTDVYAHIDTFKDQEDTPQVDESIFDLLRNAEMLLKDFGDKYVTQEILLLSFTKTNDETKYILDKNKINFNNLYHQIKMFRKDKKAMNEMAESSFDVLNRFAANLTEKATKGLLDPVIGRDEEIRRVIQVLSRRTKNNPILIGEPGVGKTAIAEGLALRIANNDVPEKLKVKQIFLWI